MSHEVQLYTLFSKNIGEMFGALTEVYPKDPELIKANLLSSGLSGQEMMKKFLINVYHDRKKIIDEDPKFLLENDSVFSTFPPGHFKKLLSMNLITLADIWPYVKVCLTLADKLLTIKGLKYLDQLRLEYKN